MEALTSIQKGQVLLLENLSQNLQQMTDTIKKGFEKLGSYNFAAFTAPALPSQISSAAAPSQLSSTMASKQIPSTAPPPAPTTLTTSAPPPMAPPLATSNPTPGFAEPHDEDTSAPLESLCSLPSSPRESIHSYHDSHPATLPPRKNHWSQHHQPTVPLKHMPLHIFPRVDQATSVPSTSQTILQPQPQNSGAAYPFTTGAALWILLPTSN